MDTNIGERLPFSEDVLLFKSPHKTIGHTNWRVIVYERPNVFQYNKGESTYSAMRFTGFQYWDGQTWKRETEHPRYNYNDGTYAGLPKTLHALYNQYKDGINGYVKQEVAQTETQLALI